MDEERKSLGGGRALWLQVGLVSFCVAVILLVVFTHEQGKARSPQALVAAALSQSLSVREWSPGMGQNPLVYHPAGLNSPGWRPLFICPLDGAVGHPTVDAAGLPHCPRCGGVMILNGASGSTGLPAAFG